MARARDINRIEKMYKMRQIGLTLDQIGEVYKMSRQAVHSLLSRYGAILEGKEYCSTQWHIKEAVNVRLLAAGGVIHNSTALAILNYLGIKPTSTKAKAVSRFDILNIYPVEFLERTNSPVVVIQDLVNLMGTMGGPRLKRQLVRELSSVFPVYRELSDTP